MRLDENGQSCPETLSEYRQLCVAIGGEDCRAVKLIDEWIAENGPEEKVTKNDSQMRMLLMPLLVPEE